MKINKYLINVLFLTIFVLCLFNSVTAVEKTDILALVGGATGAWFTRMGAMAEIIKQEEPNINIKVVPGGSFENNLRVASNEAQLAFTFPYYVEQAIEHSGDFAERPKIEEGSLLSLAGGFGSTPIHFVVEPSFAEKNGIETIKDIVVKKIPMRISCSLPGRLTSWSLEKIFNYYGASLKEFESWGGKVLYGEYSDSITQMKDGHSDAFMVDGAPPASTLVELLVFKEYKFVNLTEDAINYMVENIGFSEFVIPADTYRGQDTEVPTVAMRTIMITNNKVPEDIIFTIVKILSKNQEKINEFDAALAEFNAETAWQGLVAPLHPGAEKAYRELGYMK